MPQHRAIAKDGPVFGQVRLLGQLLVNGILLNKPVWRS